MKYPYGAIFTVAFLAILPGLPWVFLTAPLAGVYAYFVLTVHLLNKVET